MHTFPLLLFVLVCALSFARNARADDDCGTCDSLGYQCLSPSHTQLDNCGAPLNASTCPVTSCPDYCLSMFSVTGGYCSPAAHTCICDTASNCDRPLCDRLADLYPQCIPANATDDCFDDDHDVAQDACPVTHPACGADCVCSTEGVCDCPTTPGVGTSTQQDGSSTPVKVAAVPTITRITTGSKRFVFGSGAIGGTAIQSIVALGVSAAVGYAWYHKKHPTQFGV